MDLLTVIDSFSRWIVAYDVMPTVYAGSVKAIYQAGLTNLGISLHRQSKPDLRVDRGSPINRGCPKSFSKSWEQSHPLPG
jgi:hypothetical protein